jgi:hypothetical protein
VAGVIEAPLGVAHRTIGRIRERFEAPIEAWVKRGAIRDRLRAVARGAT